MSVTAENFLGSDGGFEVAFKGQGSACSKFVPIGKMQFLDIFLMHLAQAIVKDTGPVSAIQKINSCFSVFIFPTRQAIHLCGLKNQMISFARWLTYSKGKLSLQKQKKK